MNSISREAILRGYNRGNYVVGDHTAPAWSGAINENASQSPRFSSPEYVEVSDAVTTQLSSIVDEIIVDEATVQAEIRDWWAGTMIAETEHRAGAPGVVVAKVSNAEQVQQVIRLAQNEGIPVTVSAARSNVTGAALPVHGGIVLDVSGLNAEPELDTQSQIVEVEPGVYGDIFESWLQERGFTAGNWPSSFGISTVGGWVACRGAGQLSTRYGKIEDMVVGLEVVLPNGEISRTGGNPRAAVGPDLNQVFVGSEGTLGVITKIQLRVHRLPDSYQALAYGFDTFAEGLEACREILQRGATPAVLRLYDNLESGVQFGHEETNVLLIADETDSILLDAVMKISREACIDATELEHDQIMEKWLDTRYLTGKSAEGFKQSPGFVADTLEMAAPWSQLADIYDEVVDAINSAPGTLAGSAHQSHAYVDGACLYFSLRGNASDPSERQAWYENVWQKVNQILIDRGAAISHHHGSGLLRSPYVEESLGSGFQVWQSIKQALDPNNLLNPGKLGLREGRRSE